MKKESRVWKDGDHDVHYLYQESDGKIIGQVHKISHTKIWVAKVIFNYNDDLYLGEYISCEFAKTSTQNYWDIKDRTLLE